LKINEIINKPMKRFRKLRIRDPQQIWNPWYRTEGGRREREFNVTVFVLVVLSTHVYLKNIQHHPNKPHGQVGGTEGCGGEVGVVLKKLPPPPSEWHSQDVGQKNPFCFFV
jgi:hypothetical protein